MPTIQQVAHIWAQQTKEKSNPNANIYFENETIYSYGRHFPIATFKKNKHGKTAVIFTTDGYSVSTSRHIRYVENALPSGLPIFRVSLKNQSTLCEASNEDFAELYAKRLFEDYKRQLENEEKRIKQSRKYISLVYYNRVVEYANEFAKFFGIKNRVKTPKKLIDYVTKKQAQIAEREALKNTPEAIAKREKAKLARERLKEKKRAAEVAEWKTGERRYIKHERGNFVFLRINGENIETSQGASFPLSHGIKAWQIMEHCRANKTEFIRNGKTIHLGHFQIDKIDTFGNVYAGCHFVEYIEIFGIAKKLNLTA